jgi:hypothetical protein
LPNHDSLLLSAIAWLPVLGVVPVWHSSLRVNAARRRRGCAFAVGWRLEAADFRKGGVSQRDRSLEFGACLRRWRDHLGQTGMASSSLILKAATVAPIRKRRQHQCPHADHGGNHAFADSRRLLRLGVKIQPVRRFDWPNFVLLILWAHG